MSRFVRFLCRKPLLCGLALIACCGLTGCMGEYSGQNLPSPYYLGAQLQYYPPGPEFKLSREAAAQKEYRETEAQRQGAYPGQPVQQ
jgi:hypothetical protein